MANEARILWTVVPNGTAPDGMVRLSVVVSPRLLPDDDTTLKQAFADFANWRDRTLTFTVGFGSGPDERTVQAPAPTAAQKALWTALFTPQTSVEGFAFHDLSLNLLHSLPVLNVESFVADLYAKIAANPATATSFPPVDMLTEEPGGLASLAFHWKFSPAPDAPPGAPQLTTAPRDGKLPAEIAFEQAVTAALQVPNPPMAIASADPTLDFWRLKLEHTPLSTPQQVTDGKATFTGYARVEPQIPAIDFHRAVSLLGEHPALLRELGLIFDLEVLAPAQPSGAVALRQVTADPPWTGDPPQPLFAVTRYAPGFIAAPRGSEQSARMLDLTQPGYGVVDLEVDGAGHKLVNLADTIARSLWGEVSTLDTPQAFSLPSLRTAGLTLVRGDRALAIAAHAAQIKDVNVVLGSEPDTEPLFAEDLTRGYRVDIRDESLPPGIWHSLFKRTGRYRLPDAGLAWPPDEPGVAELEDEAWASLGVTSAADDASPAPDLHLREELVRWDGWSLAGRRPGGHVGTDDGAARFPSDGPDSDHGRHPDFDFWPSLRVPNGSLPRLRFGRTYRMRARAVDIAGNSLPLAGAPESTATPAREYRRYEPVPAPALVLRELPLPGESLGRLVIRSSNANAGLDAVPTQDTTDRHVAPPLASKDLCEQHSMFDALPAQDAWQLIASRQGTYDMTANPQPGNPQIAPAGAAGVEAFDRDDKPVSLDAWQDGNVPRSVTVVHHEPQLGLPYLPDPLARGAIFIGEPHRDDAPFLGLPGAPPNTLTEHRGDGSAQVTAPLEKPEVRLVEVDFGTAGEWPDLRPFRIQVVEGAAAPKWDAAKRVLEVALPKAQTARVRLSSVFGGDALALLALWRWILQAQPKPSSSTLERLEELARQGRHWMLTPFREIELVHAVQQPLRTPDVSALTVRRAIGQTSATLVHGGLTVHTWSTARVDVEAAWTEPVDPLAEPAPKTIAGTAHAFDLTVAYPPPLADADADLPLEHLHELGDTKHRRIDYRAVATTRYRECFPGKAEITRTSQPVTLSIPSSARPASPSVLYVVPTFGWNRESTGPSERASTRIGGGLRVYLERPWFSSGEGELLGVVVLSQRGVPAASIPPALSRLVTRWGADPVWASDVARLAPGTSDFPRAAANTRSGLTLAEHDHLKDPPVTVTVSVAGHPVEYDPVRRLWFADIDVETGDAYSPFIRLALARYQPNSVVEPPLPPNPQRDVHLSPVVLADFAQLTPDRSATLQRISRTELQLTVSGVGIEHGAGVQANEVRVTVETRRAGIADPDLGWAPLRGATVTQHQVNNPNLPHRSFTITLPAAAARAAPRRLVILEHERHLTGDAPADTATGRRLVYAETFAIGEAV